MVEMARTLALLRRGIEEGLHPGAQLYVSRHGEVVADVAIGEAAAGVAMTPDTLLPWFSATKAVTAVLAARLWEQGLFGLDDAVADYVPGFGTGGKAGITVRHLLTHTGGFRFGDELEAGWVPGRKAGYHPRTGFQALGELLHQVDGRAFPDLARDEVLAPLGMDDAWIGLPPERRSAYGERIGAMHDTSGDAARALPDGSSGAGDPSAGGVGPIRSLARLYEALLAGGQGVLSPVAVEAVTARHRTGMFDHTFGAVVDTGLGLILDSKVHGRAEVPYGYGPHASSRTFGHGGSQSSTAFADPAAGLVVALVCNGMPGERAHQARMHALLQAVYEDAGLGAG